MRKLHLLNAGEKVGVYPAAVSQSEWSSALPGGPESEDCPRSSALDSTLTSHSVVSSGDSAAFINSPVRL